MTLEEVLRGTLGRGGVQHLLSGKLVSRSQSMQTAQQRQGPTGPMCPQQLPDTGVGFWQLLSAVERCLVLLWRTDMYLRKNYWGHSRGTILLPLTPPTTTLKLLNLFYPVIQCCKQPQSFIKWKVFKELNTWRKEVTGEAVKTAEKYKCQTISWLCLWQVPLPRASRWPAAWIPQAGTGCAYTQPQGNRCRSSAAG